MKKANRILSMLLAVLMVISSMVVTTTVASADDTITVSKPTQMDETHDAQPTTWWHDNIPEGTALSGSGTSTDPYQISSAAEFALFAKELEEGKLNGATATTYYELTTDINMEGHQWRPIGDTAGATAYAQNTLNKAVFNGGGNTISGIKLSAHVNDATHVYNNGCAIFARISASTIKNLNIEVKILDPVLKYAGLITDATKTTDVENNAKNAGVASLVAYAYGASVIDTVTANVDMDTRGVGSATATNNGNGYTYAGLVAITGAASGTRPKFNKCTVNGDIYVDAYGRFNNGVTDTANANQTSIYVGGVIGWYQGDGVDAVTNNASMTVIASRGGSYCGGVFANTYNGPVGDGMKNTGTITYYAATGGYTHLGGVAGQLAILRNTAENVVNEGKIMFYSHNTAVYVGGIVGYIKNGNTTDAGIFNATNSGDIEFVKTSNANGGYIGGILGYSNKDFKFQNCENTGAITFRSNVSLNNSTFVSGIVGLIDGKAVPVNNCTNKGAVSVTTKGLGAAYNTTNKTYSDTVVCVSGLVNMSSGNVANGAALTECTNDAPVSYTTNGDVTTTSEKTGYVYIGGLVNKMNGSTTASSVTDCTNTANGDVTLTFNASSQNDLHRIGGIAAETYSGTISDTINYGDVTVNGLTHAMRIGGITGNLQSGAKAKLYNADNAGKITVINATNASASCYIGGIVGNYAGPSGSKIEKCDNSGDIAYTAYASGSNVGGIAGNTSNAGGNAITPTKYTSTVDNASHEGPNYSTTWENRVTIFDCINSGDVTVTNGKSIHCTLGGIIGSMITGGIVDSCTNTGTIWQKDVYLNSQATAGIVGLMGGTSIVQNSVNEGTVKLTTVSTNAEDASSNNTRNVGGIAAQMTSILKKTWTAYSDTNGELTSASKTIQKASEAKILNCVNDGDIVFDVHRDANSNIGGAAAKVSGYSQIIGFTNNGNISVQATVSATGAITTGGVVGYINEVTKLEDATNNGDVTAYSKGARVYTGGVIGHIIAKNDAYPVKNCVNTGTVTNYQSGDLASAGGIAGRTGHSVSYANSIITFQNCVNAGKIVNPETYTGGMVGYISAPSTKDFTDTNDLDGDGNKTETLKDAIFYTVTLDGCVAYDVGIDCTMVGRVMSDLVVKNCISGAPSTMYYRNQDAKGGYYRTDEGTLAFLKIDGELIMGYETGYRPAGVTVVDIHTLDKARVRITGDGDATRSGIRFDSAITKESYDSMIDMGATVQLGTVIAPSNILGADRIVKAIDKMAAMDAWAEELGLQNSAFYTNLKFYDDEGAFDWLDASQYDDPNRDDYYYFAGALENMKSNNFNRPFSAIAYAIVTFGGNTFTIYADYDPTNENRVRSIAQVADMAYHDRLTEANDLYSHKALAENLSEHGDYSRYANVQLDLLRAYSGVSAKAYEEATGLNINGNPISLYQIVYAQSPIYKNYGSLSGKTLIEDLTNFEMKNVDSSKDYSYVVEDVLLGDRYDYDEQTALRIQTLIKEKFGVEIPVVEDVTTAETPYEILVGKTNRANTNTSVINRLDVDDYIFNVEGSKMIVCGGAYGSTWHAVDALEALFAGIEGNTYNLKMAGDLSGNYDLQKIACIGDSITRGSQSLPDGSAWEKNNGADQMFGSATVEIYYRYFLSYPANLQRLVWQDAVVYNFGRGASTAGFYAANNLSNYYEGASQFYDCLATSNDKDIEFDLVFMMHGTNDSGKAGGDSGKSGAYNWTDADILYFQDAVESLMLKILEGSPNAIFVLNNIPHRFDTSANGTGEHSTMAMAAIQKTVATNLAQKYTVYHYDMNRYTRENLCDSPCEDCYTAEDVLNDTVASSGFDSKSEVDAHGKYYNTNTPFNYDEGTHPNYLGYNKMADGIQDVVDYILNNGAKPEYMIDIAG